MVAAVLVAHCVACSENLCADADPFFQQVLDNRRPTGESLSFINQPMSYFVSSVSMEDDPTGEDLDWTQWVDRVTDDPSNWAAASDQLAQQFLKVSDFKVDYDDYVSVLMELTSITPLLVLVERGVDLVPFYICYYCQLSRL